MKILHISTSENSGGAAKAAYRLHEGLRQIGTDSHMLVQAPSLGSTYVLPTDHKLTAIKGSARANLDNLPSYLYRPKSRRIFSNAFIGANIRKGIEGIDPDIIHLHWIAQGFVRLEAIKQFQRPIVWTLHDMWAFTGGCHYTNGCSRFEQKCGSCPALDSGQEQDLSRWNWHRKHKLFPSITTVITPSRWLAQQAARSSVAGQTRIEVVPNGVDERVFRPYPTEQARDLLGLGLDKKLILFGAMSATSDRRKGFSLLKGCLDSLGKAPTHPTELVVLGAYEPKEKLDLGFPIHYLGKVFDELTLSLSYAAADVFVAPSLEDNLPNTVVEALACGTPCVAFDIGGMSDLIDHNENGYLAQPFDVEDLAKGLQWVLDNNADGHLSRRAREKFERSFALERVAQTHRDLYESLLAKC